jgi:hypothetical protein
MPNGETGPEALERSSRASPLYPWRQGLGQRRSLRLRPVSQHCSVSAWFSQLAGQSKWS